MFPKSTEQMWNADCVVQVSDSISQDDNDLR